MAKTLSSIRRQIERQIRKAATFTIVAGEWLKTKSPSVRESTFARYKATIELHVLPYFGSLPLGKVTSADVSGFVEEKLRDGRLDKKGGLAASTVRGVLSIVKSVLDYAHRTHKINQPVCVTYPRLFEQAMRVLSKKEQALLESFLETREDIFMLAVLLCLYTGIRIGELCALQWHDISFEKGMIAINKTLQRVKVLNGNESGSGKKTTILVGVPKSRSSVRDIPIPKFLLESLREASKGKEGYFLSTEKSSFIEPRTMQNHFARITRELGITGANFHCLRHTFATRCIEAGVDVKSLSEMLGHSSVSLTLDRYVHSSFEQKLASIAKLEEYARQ